MLKKASFLTRDTRLIDRRKLALAKPAAASSSQNGRPDSDKPLLLSFRTTTVGMGQTSWSPTSTEMLEVTPIATAGRTQLER